MANLKRLFNLQPEPDPLAFVQVENQMHSSRKNAARTRFHEKSTQWINA